MFRIKFAHVALFTASVLSFALVASIVGHDASGSPQPTKEAADGATQQDLTRVADLWVWSGCIHTGELGGGDDEIYYLLSTNGGPSERVPSLPNKGWNVSDGEYVYHPVKQQSLKPGEKVTWILTQMEEDGGGPPAALVTALDQAGKEVAKQAIPINPKDDALVGIIKGLAHTLGGMLGGVAKLISSDDDVHGNWVIVVTNDQGNLKSVIEPAPTNGVVMKKMNETNTPHWWLNETCEWPRAEYDVIITPYGKASFAGQEEGRHKKAQ